MTHALVSGSLQPRQLFPLLRRLSIACERRGPHLITALPEKPSGYLPDNLDCFQTAYANRLLVDISRTGAPKIWNKCFYAFVMTTNDKEPRCRLSLRGGLAVRLVGECIENWNVTVNSTLSLRKGAPMNATRTQPGRLRNLDWFSSFMVSLRRKCVNLVGGENSRSGDRSRVRSVP